MSLNALKKQNTLDGFDHLGVTPLKCDTTVSQLNTVELHGLAADLSPRERTNAVNPHVAWSSE